jgi:acyl-CoA synthetase (AMP-forming)/AMP-acid ligase II
VTSAPSWPRLSTRVAELRAMGRLLRHAPRALRPSAPWNASRLLAARAQEDPGGTGLLYLDRRMSWSDLDRAVDRTARALQQSGVGPGDVVALLMDNRPEFLLAVTALSRLRAVAALVNTNATGRALEHAVAAAQPKLFLVGAEHAEAARAALPALPRLGKDAVLAWRDDGGPVPAELADFEERLARARDAPAEVGAPRADECMCYIYTSGTTGFPKAAVIRNSRWLIAGALFGASILELGPGDVVYIALPLYHSNAMFGGWGAALTTGAGMALRRKFSASKFWSDVQGFDASAFVYIGELCRYLLNQPERPEERAHRVRVITGNGLRPDIWQRFQERFGVPLIREFYGATEGNAPLVNLLGRPGMVGRLQPSQSVVRCDLETGVVLRRPDGRCERVRAGETGLLLGRISRVTSYDGYVDADATQRKILPHVFRPGDRWFDSGDLVELHEDGWISFADRVGDTFRWKGENVSTNEVAEVLNGAPGVLESNVFGVQVPGTEGRAGMACLRCDDAFSLASFTAYALERLPVYQRPYFLRLLGAEMRVTGTFKHQKTDYRREGYDPASVSDPLFFLDGERYVPLDADLHAALRAGRVALR